MTVICALEPSLYLSASLLAISVELLVHHDADRSVSSGATCSAPWSQTMRKCPSPETTLHRVIDRCTASQRFLPGRRRSGSGRAACPSSMGTVVGRQSGDHTRISRKSAAANASRAITLALAHGVLDQPDNTEQNDQQRPLVAEPMPHGNAKSHVPEQEDHADDDKHQRSREERR